MSRRKPAKTSTLAPAKTREVGARAFTRRARAVRSERGKSARAPFWPGLGGSARATLARIPRAAWVCALIACLNAASWSLVTPPFQVPDEPSHFAYTQQLVENGGLPTSNEYDFSPEEEVALRDIHQYEVQQSPENRTISSAEAQQQLQEDLAARPGRHGGGGAAGARSTPPL